MILAVANAAIAILMITVVFPLAFSFDCPPLQFILGAVTSVGIFITGQSAWNNIKLGMWITRNENPLENEVDLDKLHGEDTSRLDDDLFL